MWNNRIARTLREATLSTQLDRVFKSTACPHIGSGRLPRIAPLSIPASTSCDSEPTK
jgi:hypothetical protein